MLKELFTTTTLANKETSFIIEPKITPPTPPRFLRLVVQGVDRLINLDHVTEVKRHLDGHTVLVIGDHKRVYEVNVEFNRFISDIHHLPLID